LQGTARRDDLSEFIFLDDGCCEFVLLSNNHNVSTADISLFLCVHAYNDETAVK